MSQLQSDEPLEQVPVVEPATGETIGTPITGEPVVEPMPSWAIPGGVSRGHPKAKVGYLPRGTEPTDHNLEVYFPDAVKVVPRPKVERDDPYVGPSGKSGFEVWAQYLKELSATQIGLDAQADGTVTTAAMAEGHGRKVQELRCPCGNTGKTLMGSRCAPWEGGCQ